jgi:3-methyladenine DNA glycosylase AlkD
MADSASYVRRLRAAPGDTASLRAERKRISREVASLAPDQLLQVVHDLLHARVHRFIAYELVLHHPASIATLTPAQVESLGAGINSWGDVDCFGCFIAGPAWRAGRISDRLVHSWTRSDDWCWRRAALVATVPLNSRAQGGTGDTKRTLAVCRLLIDDREDLVVKALSWALRELSKRDAENVRGFIEEHRNRLAARVLREVGNKLVTGLKNPRR